MDDLRHFHTDPRNEDSPPAFRSPPDASRAPFPHRSPRRSSANAACGGLKPPPDRRLRRAKPSSPAEHRFLKVLPIYVQTSIPRSWRTSDGPCTTTLRYDGVAVVPPRILPGRPHPPT